MPAILLPTSRVSVVFAYAALILLSSPAVPLHADIQRSLSSSQDGPPGTAAPVLPVPPKSPSLQQPGNGNVQLPPVVVPARTVAQTVPDAVFKGSVLTEDSVWRGEVRVEGGVTVAPQATLTIEPGTTVRFGSAAEAPEARGALVIQGRLTAVGTAERPIRFSSMYEKPRSGDWQGVIFLGSEKRNRLENCRVEGAEIALNGAFSTIFLQNTLTLESGTGIRCRDCLFVMNGGGARQNDTGVMLSDSEADLREADISGNRRGLEAVRTSLALAGSSMEKNGADALYAEASRLSLSGNRISANGLGMTLLSSEGTVSGNAIMGNYGHGVSLSRSRVRMYGNGIELNGGNGLKVEDGAGAAWGNAISGNVPFDCYNAGSEEFMAVGNWWGSPDAAQAAKRIYARHMDQRRGIVSHVPVLSTRPSAIP